MSRIENFVNRKVDRYPSCKRVLKDTYQRICSVIPVKNTLPPSGLKILPGHFFGFHDVCPWSASGIRLLTHRVESDRDRRLGDNSRPRHCEVGFLDCHNDYTFHCLGTTTAWNWQEGARLQWVGDHCAIWNDFRDGELVSTQYRIWEPKGL